MICLTGDLHHMTLGTGNQQHSDITELQTAQRYLERLRAARVKVTFFVTGRAAAEEWPDLRPICDDPIVELGGHTYSCFEPALFHRVCKKLIGSYNGPPFYERLDVRRTIDVLRRRTGRTIRLWRNHMYVHGPWTDRVLAEEGIVACSDAVRAGPSRPRWTPEGLLEVPINVIPDHEHLYHAERAPEWVLRQLYGRRFIEGEADAFIFGGRDSIPRMAVRAVRSLFADVAMHVRALDLPGLAMAPARRAVYQWAYYVGHSHGEDRIARADRDASLGKRVVLERHESVRR